MNRHPSALLVITWCGSLVLGLAGCSQPASVPPGENAARAAEPDVPAAVVRAQIPTEEEEKKEVKPGADGGAFRFPKDPSGALLSKFLPPDASVNMSSDRGKAPSRSSSPSLVVPDLPLPPTPVVLPRLPIPRKSSALLPRLVLEESLGSTGIDPALPAQPSLPAGERVRIASPDGNEPPPLPILAPRPLPDRVSVDDATAEASLAAVLSAPLPQRTRPAPFLRQTLPDPYEHRRPVRGEVPAEEAVPQAGTTRPPRP